MACYTALLSLLLVEQQQQQQPPTNTMVIKKRVLYRVVSLVFFQNHTRYPGTSYVCDATINVIYYHITCHHQSVSTFVGVQMF